MTCPDNRNNSQSTGAQEWAALSSQFRPNTQEQMHAFPSSRTTDPTPLHAPSGYSDMMHWQTMASQTSALALADAYGASHGQPQPNNGGMDWMNSVPYVDPRNAQSPLLPSLYNAPMPPFAMANATTAQLTQQLSALQLQNQQSEHLVLQEQQRLLSEIQAAQELQAMLAQHQEAPQKLMSTALETASDSKVKRGGATEHLHNVSQSVQRETPDASFRRSRPISYGNRDSTGSAGQRLSGLYKNERTVPPQTLDRARNTTPSIVINQDAKAAGPSQADVNAVGMRIGPIITNSAEEHEYRPEKDKKRQSLSDKARANESPAHPPRSTSPAPTLLQPRRQPRGPPMEFFFANNFLARRSLRTRREAMSKLCASPRASSLSRLRGVGVQSPSLARET